jgi:hypothetical protein
MPRSFSLRFVLFILIVSASITGISRNSTATWNLIKQMPAPIDCGFFFDEMNGFVGSGIRDNFANVAQIYGTVDGGKTWTTQVVPNARGAVTSIFMLDKTTGYASIFSSSNTLWKTVDGGKTWNNLPMANGTAPCVYATKSAVMLTTWVYPGGVSFDGGKTFNQTFTDRQLRQSSGIDFTDDLHGVVTMGPHPTGFNIGASTYSTSDGGVNWTKGYALDESWGVYALKGSQSFFAAAEGSVGNVTNSIYRSDDNGVTWQAIYTFPDPGLRFTGHLSGSGKRLYFQTDVNFQGGMYRSDDLGLSWNPIGGPFHSRDTRFVVTGCIGQVVYAFDENGAIWKTTDGGDGTLATGAPLTLSADTLRFSSKYCQSSINASLLFDQSCLSTTIDSTVLSRNPSRAFTVPHDPRVTLTSDNGDSVQIKYDPQFSAGDTSILTIYAHQGGLAIVKKILLAGHNFTAPTPFVAPVTSVSAADSTDVAIYLVPTKDKFSISSLKFHLKFNGDVLTPFVVTTKGTLSEGAISASFQPAGNNGVLCTAMLKAPINQTSDLTKPLIYVRMQVTLSDSLGTNIVLDSFAINGPTPLGLCSTPESRFTMIPKCGDSTISITMNRQSLLRWLSVAPNPSTGGKVTLRFYLENASSLTVDLIDQATSLSVRATQSSFLAGEHMLELATDGIHAGSYLIALRTSQGETITRKLIELR